MLSEHDAKVGRKRLRCVHVNDSKVPLGSNRDHHANLGQGEMGRRALGVFLSAPRFEGLPALIETPGPEGHGPDRKEVQTAKRLRREGTNSRALAPKSRFGASTTCRPVTRPDPATAEAQPSMSAELLLRQSVP